jgi:hypothetical protein
VVTTRSPALVRTVRPFDRRLDGVGAGATGRYVLRA